VECQSPSQIFFATCTSRLHNGPTDIGTLSLPAIGSMPARACWVLGRQAILWFGRYVPIPSTHYEVAVRYLLCEWTYSHKCARLHPSPTNRSHVLSPTYATPINITASISSQAAEWFISSVIRTPSAR